MRRVLRYDGLLPNKITAQGKHEQVTPDDVRAMRAYVEEKRALDTPFDIVMEGSTPGDDPDKAAAIVLPWMAAGATWWIEALWGTQEMDDVRARIHQGPPRVEEGQ